MTRALFWKEWREQGSVVLTLIAAGLGLLIAANILLDGPSAESVTRLRSLWFGGRIALLLMTITTGLVVGASLFAAERETGTFAFLDLLPGSRWSRWWRKVLVGLLLIIGPVLAYLGLAALLGMLGNLEAIFGWSLFTMVLAVSAYGWGCFGSVCGKTSMAACGVGLAGAGIASIVAVLGTSTLLFLNRNVFKIYGDQPVEPVALMLLVALFSLFFLPLFLSALLFTAPDRGKKLRAADIIVPTLGEVQHRVSQQIRRRTNIRWFAAWRKLIWLAWHQFRWQLLVSGGLGLLLGSTLLIPEVSAAMLYPVPSLLLGVVIGVSIWNDEQSGQSLRFWSERRLPLGRLWRTKLLSGLGLLVLGMVALLSPLFVKALVMARRQESVVQLAFSNGLAVEYSFPLLQYLVVWPLYGFIFGTLFGLIFRKGIVAGAVSLMVSGVFAGVWFPSFIMGGVNPSSWLIPLGIVALLSRWLVWPAAQDRLAQRGPLLRLTVACVGMFLTVGLGLWNRAYSIPESVQTDADLKFAEMIPSYDLEQPGRDLRRVIPAIDTLRNQEAGLAVPLFETDHPILDEADALQFWGGRGRVQNASALGMKRYFPQLLGVLARGYPTAKPEFDAWLSSQCETFDDHQGLKIPAEWERTLEEASKKPIGVLDDPTEMVLGLPYRYVGKLEMVFRLYHVRGLQLQQLGQPEAYLDRLAITFQLMRTVRNKSLRAMVHSAEQVETEALMGLDRWLEKLDGRPDLLRRAVQILEDRERLADPSEMDCQLALQTMIRQNYRTPSQWLPTQLELRRQGRSGVGMQSESFNASPATEMEVASLNFAVLVPWEQERLRRLIGRGNDSQIVRPGNAFEHYLQLPGGIHTWSYLRANYNADQETHLAAAIRRAGLLKCAIRLYQHENNTLPRLLTELTRSNLISRIPKDPFDPTHGDFRYRVSQGEQLNLPEKLWKPARLPGAIEATGRSVAPVLDLGGVEELPRRDVMQFYPLSAALGVAIPALECQWHPLMSPRVLEFAMQEWSRKKLPILANQALLWSVGPNQVDDSAETSLLDERFRYHDRFGDLVFPVPLPPQERK